MKTKTANYDRFNETYLFTIHQCDLRDVSLSARHLFSVSFHLPAKSAVNIFSLFQKSPFGRLEATKNLESRKFFLFAFSSR